MTPSPDGPITVACIGDLHVGEHMERPYRELFAEISQRAHVMVLCGDLTNYGKPREAEILAEDLHGATIPIVGVLGNHDVECGHEAEVRTILREAGLQLLDGDAVVIHGVGFAGCMGAMGGFGRFMLSSFGEAAVKRFVQEQIDETLKLETALRQPKTARTLAVVHYAPVAETLAGEPLEIFPFLGTSRMAEVIDRYENVRAVVHGHAHTGSPYGRTPRGVPVYNVARPLMLREFRQAYALLEI